MLLRKRLTGAKFIGASQPGLERVLHLDFECSTELYETVTNRLTIEIMGRCSNIVFTDENGKIYDAVHQVDFSSSEKRQILPGLTYTLPPSQDKEDLLSADIKSTLERERAGRIDKRICEKFLGVAPLLGREAAFSCKGATDADIASLSDGEFEKLADFLLELRSNIENERFSPVFLYSDKPLEYYCFDIEQYGSAAKKISEISASEAVERYFSVKAAAEHIKRSSSDMTKLIATVISRLSRKVEAQRGELKECEKADVFKRYGDIITSNMYLLKGGEKTARLVDYYAEEPTECTVELDPRLSPTANAQKYYKNYRKAKKWFEKAARQGRADAQTFLGMLYSRGQGTEQDYAAAKTWFEKAAEQDFAPAQTLVGIMYAKGVGTFRNITQAERWLVRAADQGENDAATFLGILYLDGKTLPHNPEEAFRRFTQAAERGDANAQAALGMMYFSGEATGRDPQKAATGGNTDAQTFLGTLYYRGIGVEKNIAKAGYWLQKAAIAGDADAQDTLNELLDTTQTGTDTTETTPIAE